MRRKITAGLLLLFCVALLWTGGAARAAAADEGMVDTLFGSVGLLKQENGNYVMQVTVQNDGEDFTGTVQVIFASNGFQNCAYNTDITLPSRGKKQFTITVTEQAAETVRGLCALNFLDQKGRLLQSLQLKNVFGSTANGISVGILSDNYADLTWLDAGGENFSIRGAVNMPLSLVELNGDNLKQQLDGLYFLVIDQFNVASLDGESIQAIQKWVENGGWLLIGTGAYAEQTLSGFSEDFLALNILEISQPGEENLVSAEMENYGFYYYYQDWEVDFTQMAIASLEYTSQRVYRESSDNPVLLGDVGDGAVGVFLFSFGEKELQKMDGYAVQNMFSDVMYTSDSYRTYSTYYDSLQYTGQRALAFLDNRQTDLDFTWLEVLIGVYVVLVGPILYLILRKCKKSEWYWAGVPVMGLVFILGVYFFGRDVRVREPKVYSVAVQQTDSTWRDTYFLAYQAGVKSWELLLDDSYSVAGPGLTGYGYWSNSTNVSDYLYTVREAAEGVFMGIKPQENFENAYLYAGGRTQGRGNLQGVGLSHFGQNLTGTVRNETGLDLDYMAVWYNSGIAVFSDVKAGEELDLSQAVADGRRVYQDTANGSFDYDYSNLLSSMVFNYWTQTESYDRSCMAALFIGLGSAVEKNPSQSQAVIVGVAADYEKAVAGKCSEVSYGCFYSYANMD
ncbi:MAG: hypothetical protein NC541_07440 [bacterium]|nr:hypothetical protein [bacterium]